MWGNSLWGRFGALVWDNLVGHSGEARLAGHSSKAFLRHTLVVQLFLGSCKALLWRSLAGHPFGESPHVHVFA